MEYLFFRNYDVLLSVHRNKSSGVPIQTQLTTKSFDFVLNRLQTLEYDVIASQGVPEV